MLMSNAPQTEHNNLTVEVNINDHDWSPRFLPRGRHGGLICAESGEEFHSSYNPESIGYISYRKKLWFSSTFNHNLHSWKNHQAPYDTPESRVGYKSLFEKFLVEDKVVDNESE
jgi:hypothetical protein